MTAALRRGRWVVRLPGLGIHLRLHLRTIWVSGLLLAAVAGVALLTVTTVGAPLTLSGALDVLAGGGTTRDRFVLMELRLPRLALGALVGAAFALSGAVFQSLTRNPLGSPDIVGFSQGAASGAITAILLLHAGPGGAATGAVVGGLVTAVVVYRLSTLHGGQPHRLVLVGIGISAILLAVNNFLISRARIEAAHAAEVWLIGTLNGRTWHDVALVGLTLLPLTPALLIAGRWLHLLEMGPDAAQALGLRAGRSRLLLIVLAVIACAVATAASGPVAFVALAAPQIARRLTGAPALQLVPSALVGAVLVLAGDHLAQQAFAPAQVPVGVVTGALGGVYLAWLLTREWRRGRET